MSKQKGTNPWKGKVPDVSVSCHYREWLDQEYVRWSGIGGAAARLLESLDEFLPLLEAMRDEARLRAVVPMDLREVFQERLQELYTHSASIVNRMPLPLLLVQGLVQGKESK